MELPLWSIKYVGIPYRVHADALTGADCYGLVRMVLREQAGLVLPAYTAEEDMHRAIRETASLFETAVNEKVWEKVPIPAPFDVVILRIGGVPFHCGVMVSPVHMLHIMEQHSSIIERIDAAHWTRRVMGYWRFVGAGAVAHD